VYARWHAHRWAVAPDMQGRAVYAVTMRNRRLTGELRAGRFVPHDTPAARRVALECVAPLMLAALERCAELDVLRADPRYRGTIVAELDACIAAAKGQA
jgi:hypothetical protein